MSKTAHFRVLQPAYFEEGTWGKLSPEERQNDDAALLAYEEEFLGEQDRAIAELGAWCTGGMMAAAYIKRRLQNER